MAKKKEKKKKGKESYSVSSGYYSPGIGIGIYSKVTSPILLSLSVPRNPPLPFANKNSINKVQRVPYIGLNTQLQVSNPSEPLSLHLKPPKLKAAWSDLQSTPPNSLSNSSAATAAKSSPVIPTASSVISAAKPASSPFTAPFPFPVSSLPVFPFSFVLSVRVRIDNILRYK